MSVYVDGFVIPVPKKSVSDYLKISRRAGRIWKDLGALEYRECVADDVNVNFGMPFAKLARAKSNETVVFSWIVFKSKAHRGRVNAQVMKDPRMAKMMKAPMPFDMKRMSYGGFACKVDL